MLLPSALTCESSPPAFSRPHAALFVSPPASPPTLSSQSAFGNIVTTCRNLQSLIAPPLQASTSPIPAQLPTPPLSHAAPPLKLRLRARGVPDATARGDEHAMPRKRIVKRAPPRGVNKRRRAMDDEMGRDEMSSEEDIDSELDIAAQQSSRSTPEAEELPARPSTPKRARIAPEQIPLGLERSDFHELHLQNSDDTLLNSESDQFHDEYHGADVEVEADGEEWSAEDDRVLVELVLEKLKLSKTEWQDCARSLGRKDRHSVGRRWKSLMLAGDVGVKTRSSGRRARLHSTWR